MERTWLFDGVLTQSLLQTPFEPHIYITKFGVFRGIHYFCSLWIFVILNEVLLWARFEPAYEIMVLTTQATREGSGKPAHLHSLARAIAVCTHEVWKKMKGPTKNQTSSPTGWLRMRIWRMSLKRMKSAIISWDGSFIAVVRLAVLENTFW